VLFTGESIRQPRLVPASSGWSILSCAGEPAYL
jgi:hypothetical protein